MSEAKVSDEPRVDESGRRISVGSELRRAREVRRVTLAQLAAETRIALRHLEALEQDRLEDLPGRLYARNFVRTIARTLGADEAELLDYFDYQAGSASAAVEAAAADARLAVRRRVAFGALGAAALVIVAALGFALWRASSDESGPEAAEPPRRATQGEASPPGPAERGRPAAPRSPAGAAAPEAGERTAPEDGVPGETARAASSTEAAGTPVEAVRPAATPSRSEPEREPASERATPSAAVEPEPARPPAAAPPREEPEPAPRPAAAPPREESEPAPAEPAAEAEPVPRVRLAFNGPSWVEIVPEGSGEQIMGLKTANDEIVFDLDAPFEVTVANAGNVELWIDGRPARPLGAPGEPRTLRLDARSWRSLLR